MKIFTKAQIYLGDKLTAERQNISSTELMERAGTSIFNWLHEKLNTAKVPIHVFCGIGYNGGDGLVVARQLLLSGYIVNVYIVNYSDKRSKDFLNNYERIKQATKDWPIMLNANDELPNIAANDIVVDAIFGIGLNKPIATWVEQLFIHINSSGAYIIAIDIPSGLTTDKLPKSELAVIKANYTLSFLAPKLIFFLPQTAYYTKDWESLDIGIDAQYIMETETDTFFIEKHDVFSFYKPRERFSHKGNYGHVVIIGGSYGKIGAVNLASKAALSAGAGLVTAFIPKCGYIPIQSGFPEAMVITDAHENQITKIELPFVPSVIGIGVGMGTSAETINAFDEFLKTNTAPMVIDADALNILAINPKLLKQIPKDSVLTPHPKELERLIGSWKDDFDKIEKTKAFSIKYNVIVLIKGANSITVYDNKLYINGTGNPGLATAGTGDVLTGIISGLIAQNYSPLVATLFGAYLHGRAADIAFYKYSMEGITATHVVEYLGEAFLDLFKKPEPITNPEG